MARGRKRAAQEGRPGQLRQDQPGTGAGSRTRPPGQQLRASAQLHSWRPRRLKSPPPPTFSKNHTREGEISQAFPMKSFPQALPTPRASWRGPPPPSLPPVQHPPRLRAHSYPKPLTSPRPAFLPQHKAPLFCPPDTRPQPKPEAVQCSVFACLGRWGWGPGGKEQKGVGGKGSKTPGSVFTLDSPHSLAVPQVPGDRLQWASSSHILQRRGAVRNCSRFSQTSIVPTPSFLQSGFFFPPSPKHFYFTY